MNETETTTTTERVPSWMVTTAMLAEWGFPVEVRDHCVGMQMVVSAGMTFGRAVFEAWGAGFVTMRSMPEAERAAWRAEVAARKAVENAVHEETFAWAMANCVGPNAKSAALVARSNEKARQRREAA